MGFLHPLIEHAQSVRVILDRSEYGGLGLKQSLGSLNPITLTGSMKMSELGLNGNPSKSLEWTGWTQNEVSALKQPEEPML